MAPRIVEMEVMKTGNVPNLAVVLCGWKFAMSGNLKMIKSNEDYEKKRNEHKRGRRIS